MQNALRFLSLEDRASLWDGGKFPLPSFLGTSLFQSEFLPMLAKAVCRRERWLKREIAQLETGLAWILEDHGVPPGDLKVIARRLRERLDRYDGPPSPETFIQWACVEIGATIKALR